MRRRTRLPALKPARNARDENATLERTEGDAIARFSAGESAIGSRSAGGEANRTNAYG